VAALVARYHLTIMSIQMVNTENPFSHKENCTYIGQLDTSFNNLITDTSLEEYATVLERAEDGSPMVEALPSEMVILSMHPDYVRPEHYGWAWNNLITYIALALCVAIVLLVAWLLLSAIRGFRTGNIFRDSHPRLLRWLSLVVFLYYILNENREVFRQIAVKDLYGDSLPFDVYGSITISTECLMAPLLLLVLAELMAIAARINEDESMTI
jgi:hypothetical protein